MEIQLKFEKNKNYHETNTAYWYIFTFLWLKRLTQRLIDVTSVRLSKSLNSRSILFRHTNNFGSVFPHRLNRGIY
jgi:hypothetical protein